MPLSAPLLSESWLAAALEEAAADAPSSGLAEAELDELAQPALPIEKGQQQDLQAECTVKCLPQAATLVDTELSLAAAAPAASRAMCQLY